MSMLDRVEQALGARQQDALERVTEQVFQPEQYQWWHAVLLGVAANTLSFAGFGRRTDEQRFYNSMKQAPFAPPGWVFGPAWTINNVSTLWGNLRLLNLPETTPNKRTLIVLQALSWAIFSSFSYVYFNRRSPILAFVWTATMYALTIATIMLSWRIDRNIVLSLGTLFAWLSLATAVAAYQIVYNPDPLFGTKALR